MSRHRIVRSMNYEDEYYDEDDDYSRSLEDNYCISPSTAAQFTWNRERNMNFASYMGVKEDVIDEVEEDETAEESSLQNTLNDSQARLQLNDTDQARLNSCLDEIRTILGDSLSESVIADVVVKNNFNIESSLNELLTKQDAPKPQREPRNKRNRSQDDNDDTNQLNMLLVEIQNLESLPKSEYHVPELLRFKSNPGNEEDEESTDNLTFKVDDKNCKVKLSHVEKLCSEDKNSVISGLSQNLEFCKSSVSTYEKPLLQQEDVKSSELIPHPSLADLAKQSKVSNVKKDHTNLSGETNLNLESLRLNSKLNAMGDTKSEVTKTDKGKLSLADLAKQHSGGSGASELKKIGFGGSEFSNNMKEKRNIDKLKDLNPLEGKRKGVVKGPSSNISLSELAKNHKSNVNSLVDLKIGLESKVTSQGVQHMNLNQPFVGTSNLRSDMKQVSSSSLRSTEQSLGKLSLVSCLKNSKPACEVSVNEKRCPTSDIVDEDLLEHGSAVIVNEMIESPTAMENIDFSLISQPSCSGIVFSHALYNGSNTLYKRCVKRKIKYPSFLCHKQVKKQRVMYPDDILHPISPFNFSTLSPDDIVKNKQKKAFGRSDKKFKLGDIS